MHKLKSNARKHAWDAESHEGIARYIPFSDRQYHKRHPSKGMSHSGTGDLERGAPDGYDHHAHHTHSATCVPTFRELERQQQDAHAPPRSSTEPTSNFSPATEGPGNALTKRFHRNKKSSEQGADQRDLEREDSGKSKKSWKSKHIPVMHQVKSVFWSWPNILLVCVPVGIALDKVNVEPLAVFIVNFLAIIPLAGILSYATEELALRVGETFGGLLNASFGNATELIVAIIALVKGQILIVQTSLVGSILSNLLLVLGMCFALGGYNRPEQHFNMTVAQTACSLLILAGASLIIPTAFAKFSNASDGTQIAQINAKLPALSRGTAIILLFVYGCYLFFQLRTHINVYNAPSEKTAKQSLVRRNTTTPDVNANSDVSKGISQLGAPSSIPQSATFNAETIEEKDHANQKEREEDEEEEEEPNLSLIGGIITLCGATALIGVASEFVVDTLGEVSQQNHVPLEFIGLILLPIVGNAAEHATAVTVAIKDKMDLAIGVAVGSSLQIALLVIPLSVVLGWIIGPKDGQVMTLSFDGFVIAILFVSILLVNYLIQDGKSHWLEGVMLMTTYIIIAVSAWFYPDDPNLQE